MRVVDNLRNRYGFTLNDDFLSQMSSCHGGRPQIATFEVNGEQWPIGQFLTLLDNHSDLVPPSRPHFDHSDIDERAIDSINYLVDGEHSTSRALFEGLMPFAATAVEMCLDRAYVNLLCLDHRVAKAEPSVVMWLADEANEAYMMFLFPGTPSTSVQRPLIRSGPTFLQFRFLYGELDLSIECMLKAFCLSEPWVFLV